MAPTGTDMVWPPLKLTVHALPGVPASGEEVQ
jgi:hypothetical protein